MCINESIVERLSVTVAARWWSFIDYIENIRVSVSGVAYTHCCINFYCNKRFTITKSRFNWTRNYLVLHSTHTTETRRLAAVTIRGWILSQITVLSFDFCFYFDWFDISHRIFEKICISDVLSYVSQKMFFFCIIWVIWDVEREKLKTDEISWKQFSFYFLEHLFKFYYWKQNSWYYYCLKINDFTLLHLLL